MKLPKSKASYAEKDLGPNEEYVGWTLTSGMRLEEFAEQGGYLAPLLLMTNNMPGLRDWVKKQD